MKKSGIVLTHNFLFSWLHTWYNNNNRRNVETFLSVRWRLSARNIPVWRSLAYLGFCFLFLVECKDFLVLPILDMRNFSFLISVMHRAYFSRSCGLVCVCAEYKPTYNPPPHTHTRKQKNKNRSPHYKNMILK